MQGTTAPSVLLYPQFVQPRPASRRSPPPIPNQSSQPPTIGKTPCSQVAPVRCPPTYGTCWQKSTLSSVMDPMRHLARVSTSNEFNDCRCKPYPPRLVIVTSEFAIALATGA